MKLDLLQMIETKLLLVKFDQLTDNIDLHYVQTLTGLTSADKYPYIQYCVFVLNLYITFIVYNYVPTCIK